MMTEIQILEGQKDVSSLEGTTLKKTYCTLIKLNFKMAKKIYIQEVFIVHWIIIPTFNLFVYSSSKHCYLLLVV